MPNAFPKGDFPTLSRFGFASTLFEKENASGGFAHSIRLRPSDFFPFKPFLRKKRKRTGFVRS